MPAADHTPSTTTRPPHGLTAAEVQARVERGEVNAFFVGDGQWLVHNLCDISNANGLPEIFKKHKSTSGQCDTCTNRAGAAIRDAYTTVIASW